MDNAKRFDVRCMEPANTPDGDVWYCSLPIDHAGVHEYQPWHREQLQLCRCADEVRCDMRNRIAELEAKSTQRKRCLAWLWDAGRIIDVHEPECPQDDTCVCVVAATINKALEGG